MTNGTDVNTTFQIVKPEGKNKDKFHCLSVAENSQKKNETVWAAFDCNFPKYYLCVDNPDKLRPWIPWEPVIHVRK